MKNYIQFVELDTNDKLEDIERVIMKIKIGEVFPVFEGDSGIILNKGKGKNIEISLTEMADQWIITPTSITLKKYVVVLKS
jgi:hypothetical protein